MFKVNNTGTQVQERQIIDVNCVFSVNSEHISHLFLVFFVLWTCICLPDGSNYNNQLIIQKGHYQN